jgi:hypothetical protein
MLSGALSDQISTFGCVLLIEEAEIFKFSWAGGRPWALQLLSRNTSPNEALSTTWWNIRMQ